MFEKIIEKVYRAKSILLFTHVNMDGDAMGSTMALCRVMRKLGKDCRILIEDPVPRYLDFMDDGTMFAHLSDYRASGHGPADLAIAVDIGQDKRLESRLPEFRTAKESCCIDHHRHTTEDSGFAEEEIRDASAAAACILVQEMLEEMEQGAGELIDKDVAEDLYVGIMTDTGSFRFSNTDSRTHLAVARLFARGIDHSKISTYIYDSYPMAQLKLEALAMARAMIFCEGKACISWACAEDFKTYNADYSMSETCIDRLRSIEGVEIAAFIREKEDGAFKVSMRSKLYADVGSVCAQFSGGGHMMAAGCSFKCPVDDIVDQLKPAIERELAKWTE